MTRRKALLGAAILVVLAASILGGIQIVGAIQGGNADTEMTKSVARITYYDQDKDKAYEVCTGSVVGDGWVLTALHCIFPGGTAADPINVRHLQVELWKAGVTNIKTPDYSSGLSFVSLGDPPYPPVSWMSDGLSGNANDWDVALLHLANPMPSWAKTIPMAPSWPSVGTALTEYGYGNLDNNETPTSATSLQKSQQGSIKRAGCPTHSGYAWKRGHICTSVSTSLPWRGDSGGPLLWWTNGYWQQVGTFSLFPRNKDPDRNWRSYWSESDTTTRNWILSYVFSTLGSKSLVLGGPPPVGTILRDPASGYSWLYESDGYRHWIPDGATFTCLTNAGVHVVNHTLRTIEALPDMKNVRDQWATCTPPPAPTSPPAPTVTARPAATVTPSLPPTVTPAPPHPHPTPTPVPPQSHPVNAYDNYGQSNLAGHAMCRGNPGNPLSMPGGTGTQTFTVPSGVATLSSAKVQIDPASVTGHMTISVNGHVAATAVADAVGDTMFSFGPVPVQAGDVVSMSITFTATYGKIITLYTVGNPGGTFTAKNTCPDGAPSFSTSSSGLRAVVSGMS